MLTSAEVTLKLTQAYIASAFGWPTEFANIDFTPTVGEVYVEFSVLLSGQVPVTLSNSTMNLGILQFVLNGPGKVGSMQLLSMIDAIKDAFYGGRIIDGIYLGVAKVAEAANKPGWSSKVLRIEITYFT